MTIRRCRVEAIDAVEDLEALNLLIDNISSERRTSAQQELRRLADAWTDAAQMPASRLDETR